MKLTKNQKAAKALIEPKAYSLSEACELLKKVTYTKFDSTVEIAVKLGYTDAHNFARTYKKCTGLSPSAYREAYAKRLLFHV